MNSVALDRWILEQRPARATLDPLRPHLYFAEDECSHQGTVVSVNTIFLTNRECPWKCLMCDLWKNTLTESLPNGAIPAQIEFALSRLPAADAIKLYNSGSFFDTGAIPISDYPAIARLVSQYKRVIVESHPSLIAENCLRFRDQIDGRLEVAMGLETVHPEILARLNKRMTLDQFASAAATLASNGIDLRGFILVKPPYMAEQEALEWSNRSVDFAFDCGATAASLIPTRGGNGAMEALAAHGDFTAPGIRMLEAALEYGVGVKRGRVFADLWDLEKISRCALCFSARAARLREMNLRQVLLDPIDCPVCGTNQ